MSRFWSARNLIISHRRWYNREKYWVQDLLATRRFWKQSQILKTIVKKSCSDSVPEANEALIDFTKNDRIDGLLIDRV